MLRRILRVLSWAAGLLAALCVAVYVIVFVSNRHDAEPSEAAIRLAQTYASRPAVRDEANGFVYLMGFDVAPGEDPATLGLKRIEWVQHYNSSATQNPVDPVGEQRDYGAARDPILQEYSKACSPSGTGCSKTFEAAVSKFPVWEASEPWLLERYRTLINHAGWREFVPDDFAAPLPPYRHVMDGQKLLLLKAGVLARDNDATALNGLLAADLRFWRTVLASSDTLITKMIATVAITRHFRLGAITLRTLPPRHVAAAIPAEWRIGLTGAELSMSRCLAGEYVYMANMLRNLRAREEAELLSDEGFAARQLARFSAPFYQPQDTINRGTAHLARAVELLEGVPLADYEAATDRVTALGDSPSQVSFWLQSPYNPFGQLILRWGPGDYGTYARRVSDVEGVRRAALAAVHLHEDQVRADEMPAALAESEFRNPYDDQPFEWDAAEAAVVFRGLQPGDRGIFRIG